MIQATVIYPRGEGTTFDFDYYLNNHMPMLAERFGEHCLQWSIDKMAEGPYVSIAHIQIDSWDGLNEVMGKHEAELMGDRVNWTDIEPIIVFGEVIAHSSGTGSEEIQP